MTDAARQRFVAAVTDPGPSVAEAALRLAVVEFPRIEPAPWLERLDEMGTAAAERMAHADRRQLGRASRVAALVRYLYVEEGFRGDREHYEDPRNSCLNDVIDRRSGIPITLAIVFLEVAARAGLHAEGVNFPGHFLVRIPASAGEPGERELLIDPFHEGAIVSKADCARLLRTHVDGDIDLTSAMFSAASKRDILVRMLHNLKRAYVRIRSFRQARHVTDLLVALDPADLSELRDRGLLSYQLREFAPALRDLETSLRLASGPADTESREEFEQTWEHVKALRRQVARLN